MKEANTIPSTLMKKIAFTSFIGICCLIFGIIYHLTCNDKVLLGISISVVVLCQVKAYTFYRLVKKRRYIELTGICIRVSSKPLSKYRKIKLIDDNLVETELIIKNDMKILIGYRYKFYMKDNNSDNKLNLPLYMPTMQYDALLGYECLGEA